MIVWSHFLRQKKFRAELSAVLPHAPTSPNAYAPTDIALGYLGGILAGADKLCRSGGYAECAPRQTRTGVRAPRVLVWRGCKATRPSPRCRRP